MICFNTDLSNLSKVWSTTYQSPSLHTAFLSDRNPWIDTYMNLYNIYIYIYIYTIIDTAKIFVPSHHTCKRTPRTSRLVPPRTAFRLVDQGIKLIFEFWELPTTLPLLPGPLQLSAALTQTHLTERAAILIWTVISRWRQKLKLDKFSSCIFFITLFLEYILNYIMMLQIFSVLT